MRKGQSWFWIEVTDTFGGEANYCWVNRYKVAAKSMRGAIVKVHNATGYNFRCTGDYGDMTRYDASNSCTCAFVEYLSDYHKEQKHTVLA